MAERATSDSLKPNINPPVMKIDAPFEEFHKQENEDNSNNMCSSKNEEFKLCSPFKSSVSSTSNPFASPIGKASRGILKPPQLSLNNSTLTKSPFTLNPSKLNPFDLKVSSEDKSDTSGKKLTQVNGETPKFVPLINKEVKTSNVKTQDTCSSSTSGSSSSSSKCNTETKFVFGQNLQERVLAAENKSDDPKPSTSLNSNGTTTEMLFSSALKHENLKVENNTVTKEGKSLSESAREYEESRANKRKYEEVEVKTGEEEETNILSISCKLFAFDKPTVSWQERGRGTLRLNDFDVDVGNTQSRLVFRTSGSLRVVLNTKIWAEMTVEQASEKSIRLTALDANGEVKVFLIMSSIEDSKQLYSQLESRVEKEISAQKRKKHNSDSGGH